MNSLRNVCVAMLLLPVLFASVSAQTTGDFQTTGAGLAGAQWSAPATWQRYSGSAWVAAPAAPTGAGVITIQSADSVFIDAAVSVSGTLRNRGKLGGASSLTIADGGTYEHAEPNGSIPVCTWAIGSTCLVSGYTTGSKPSNANQNFHHFRWSCAGQTANIDLGMTGNTIGGDFIVDTTGASRVYLTSPAAYVYGSPITINGNVIVNGGQFSSNGSSSADTIQVLTGGNLIVNGGNFSVSRGSGPNVTWELSGDLTVANAALQNSGGSTRVNTLAFVGTGAHALSLTNVAYGGGTSYFTMEVRSGSTLDLGTTVISSSNSGSFIVQAGAALASGHPGGIDSSVRCTGTSNGGGNSFSTAASYTFNGSVPQVTGLLMPATVDTLTIDNGSGVTLSRATTINGRLRLKAGVFNNTIPFTLGTGATVSFEGGSLLIPLTSVEPITGSELPRSFFVEQNFPNPFNPSTEIAFGVPRESRVRLEVFNLIGQQVALLFDEVKPAGFHSIRFDAAGLPSGMYLYKISAGGVTLLRKMLLVK